MVMTSKGIDLGAIGMRESSVKTREKLEASQEKLVDTMYQDALERIKKVTKSETSPVFISFAISKFMEEYGVTPEDKTVKTQLAYRLRGSDNIVTELGEAEGRTVPDNMKPFAYSYVKKEHKDAMGVEAYCMKNLNTGMKQYIHDRAKKMNVGSKTYDLFLVCDYLVSRGADKEWKKLMGLKLSADIGQPVKRTKSALEDLKLINILLTGKVKRNTRGKDVICRLAFDIKEYSKLNNALLSGEAADEYLKNKGSDIVVNPRAIESMVEVESKIMPKSKAKETLDNIVNNYDKKGLGLLSHQKIGLEDQGNLTNDTSYDKIGANSSYKFEQKETVMTNEIAIKQIESALKYLKTSKNGPTDNDDVKRKVERLQKLLEASQKESIELRSELMKAERKLNKLQHQLSIQSEFNEEYAAEARKAMNQLISVTSSVTEKFTQISPKRVTADDIAEFKNGIISAAGEAQNRLRDFTYSRKVEPLKN